MGNFETAPFGHPYSIRPMNQKAWIDVKRPRFSYLQPIQYIEVMESCTTSVLSPTNQCPVLKINHCDIVFISQLENSATCSTNRVYIFGYATHTLAGVWVSAIFRPSG